MYTVKSVYIQYIYIYIFIDILSMYNSVIFGSIVHFENVSVLFYQHPFWEGPMFWVVPLPESFKEKVRKLNNLSRNLWTVCPEITVEINTATAVLTVFESMAKLSSQDDVLQLNVCKLRYP